MRRSRRSRSRAPAPPGPGAGLVRHGGASEAVRRPKPCRSWRQSTRSPAPRIDSHRRKRWCADDEVDERRSGAEQHGGRTGDHRGAGALPNRPGCGDARSCGSLAPRSGRPAAGVLRWAAAPDPASTPRAAAGPGQTPILCFGRDTTPTGNKVLLAYFSRAGENYYYGGRTASRSGTPKYWQT